jgi:hypothetical protein
MQIYKKPALLTFISEKTPQKELKEEQMKLGRA